MSDHSFLLNENNTEDIIIAAPNNDHLQDFLSVSVRGRDMITSSTILNLGITIDCGQTIWSDVSRVCKSAYYQSKCA